MTQTEHPSIKPNIAVVGAGPAGLMAATTLAKAGACVHLYDKRPKPGRKLLVAGASGLNVAADASTEQSVAILGSAGATLAPALVSFPKEAWLEFIEHSLNLKTFLGTSARYFVKDMKAAKLLTQWMQQLNTLGVEFVGHTELSSFSSNGEQVCLSFNSALPQTFDGVIFAMGGASWENTEAPPSWVHIFEQSKVRVNNFISSNCGFHVDQWTPDLIKEANRLPLKGVILKTARGEKMGDLLVTDYGLEGTPLYWVGTEGEATLDLLPELSYDQVYAHLNKVKENMNPVRRAYKALKLCPAAKALIHHTRAPGKNPTNLELFTASLKAWPLTLTHRRPLTEAISSIGGVSLEAVNNDLSLKGHPYIFVSGEMLDWDAPTGGYLIHTSVATGFYAAHNLIERLHQKGLLPLDPGCLA